MDVRLTSSFKKMIVGHGIDLQDITAIERAVQKNARFSDKLLTAKELERYQTLKGKRQMEYLAGRWAAKEAFVKALGTGIGKIGFQDIEILSDEKGAPVVTVCPFAGRVWLSISHSGQFVQASVILEEKDD